MSLSLGIVGLPNVGKSTLFSALTRQSVEIANYPFATIDPSVGVVEVSDTRLDRLSEMSRSRKKIPTVVEFTDIAGLVKGASQGVGLGNQFLSHIASVDAIVLVVRMFEGGDIQHVEGSVDPKRDVEIVRSELALKDIETLEKRIQGLTKEVKRGEASEQELEVLQEWLGALNNDTHIYQHLAEREYDEEVVASLLRNTQLLTTKPVLCVANVHGEVDASFVEYMRGFDCEVVAVDVRAELESVGMTQEERVELGLERNGLEQLIHTSYKTLDLISFFTTGESESRCWTTKKGSSAPVAGGVIHSDFQNFFIRAEVVQWDVLLKAGSWSEARTQGVLRTEGKEYMMQDGDVVVFLHNP